jgi:hypothetical protein
MWELCNLTVWFLDVAKFTTVTALSLLISCKLSFPIVSLKMSSLPTLALKSLSKIHVSYFGKLSNIHSISHRNGPSHNKFCHLLGHERSEK